MKNIRKVIAVILCVMMVFGNFPMNISFAAETAGIIGAGNPVTDAGTLNAWKGFFFGENGEATNTLNAGGVWTDKSVFASAEAFRTAQEASGTGNAAYNNMSIGESNFLVALSAIASNKEIVGYSAIPTDTVFILDLSASMSSEYVETMVDATNKAITDLMELNGHNRVSVVLYSGNSVKGNSNLGHATVLLPLDRYTTTKTEGSGEEQYNVYIVKDENSVKTYRSIKDSTGNTVEQKSKAVSGGTYIQSGLYLARQELMDADTVIDSGLIQGGTKRMPIIALMSDGEPTAATNQYATFTRTSQEDSSIKGVSNKGNGTQNTNAITFLTQITAKWVKESVAEHYDNDVLFYTLWLKNPEETKNNPTLQPSYSEDNIDGWWKTFLNAEAGSSVSFGSGNSSFSITRDSVIDRLEKPGRENAEYTAAWQKEQNYVDRSFNATSSDTLDSAFENIVKEIVIQSQYYPTLVEGIDYDTDGYITIEDSLGEYMEVKEIEGIVIGRHLFSGSALIEMMYNNQFGSAGVNTEEGWALIESLMVRTGVNKEDAVGLAGDAWRYGQLGRVNVGTENNPVYKYSNYIGWWADENNNCLGFWHEGMTDADKPAGATQIMKSYGFYGVVYESISDSNIEGSNMMFVAVRVATHISDKDQTVTFGVPASLIPLIKYEVSVTGASLENAENPSLRVTGANHPIRLLMEVGVRDEINELTVEEAGIEKTGHHYDAQTGEYIFFSNRWGDDNDTDDGTVHVPDGSNAGHATVAYYKPSFQNEKYFYSEDSVIYTKNGSEYVKYSGSEKPAGGNYYAVVYNFVQGVNQIEKIYKSIGENVIATAQKSGNNWYIPQGTARENVETTVINKGTNVTGTLAFVSKTVPPILDANGVYHIYELLGNNGIAKVKPETGIKLTKSITAVEPNTVTTGFNLNVKFTGANLPEKVKVSYDGKTYSEETLNNGAVSVVLDNEQSVYIYGLPAGVDYTVTENIASNADYKPAEDTVAGQDLAAGTITDVVFTNVPNEPGHLVINKVVEDPYADKEAPAEKRFTVKVALTNVSGTVNPVLNHSNSDPLKGGYTFENNVITFSIANGEIVSITGIPHNVKYTVTEENPDGFTLVTAASELEGTISGETSNVTLVNKYEPGTVTGSAIKVVGNKNLFGRDWKAEDKFEFALRFWNGSHWVYLDEEGNAYNSADEFRIATENENKASDPFATENSKDFDISDYIKNVTFARPGIYTFWAVEIEDVVGGVAFDTTHRSFSVEVVDNWNGVLEIEEVSTTDNKVTVTKENNIYTVSTDFTNVYAPDGSEEIEIEIEKFVANELFGTDLSGFEFGLFKDDGTQVGENIVTDASGHNSIKLVFDSSMLNKVENRPAEIGEETDYRYDETVINYVLKEIAPASGIAGMDYTEGYFDVKVTLEDNTEGGIYVAVEITKNGEKVEVLTTSEPGVYGVKFENTYKLEPNSVTVEGTKEIAGRNFVAGDEFVFEMYKTNADFDTAGVSVLKTATVSGEGKEGVNSAAFSFGAIEFDEADVGTHYFVVKEKNAGQLIKGVTYSTEEYYITVTVGADADGDGKLDVAKTVVKKDGTAASAEIKFTNVYETEAITVRATKVWAGDDADKRPAVVDVGTKIDFKLQVKTENNGAIEWKDAESAAGLIIDGRSISAEANGDWSVVYDIVFDKGAGFVDGDFRIVESIVPEGYQVSNGGAEDENGVITNTYKKNPPPIVVTVDFTVRKVWNDGSNENGERPDSVTVQLYANGKKYGTSFTLSEANNWQKVIRNLPARDVDGSAIVYTAKEVEVPKNYSVSYNNSATGTTIVNSYNEESNPATGAPIDW